MMSYFYIFSIFLSIGLTVYLLEKFNLKGHIRLSLLNAFIPFAGFLYAVYLIHYVIPNAIERDTGVHPESPFQPFVDNTVGFVAPKVKTLVQKIKVAILGDKNDHRID